MPVCNSFKSCI